MGSNKYSLKRIALQLENIYKNEENILISAVSIKYKTFVLRLVKDELSWYRISKETCSCSPNSLDISEVPITSKGEAVKCRDIVRIDFEANPTTVGGDGGDDSSAATSVTLHYVIKHKKYRWSLGIVTITMTERKHCEELKAAVERKMTTEDRPQSLLIFINPISGSGRANTVYNKYVKQLFQKCGLECTILCTEYANHAKQLLSDHDFDISSFDGIVCIGGDGSLLELVHGIMARVNPTAPVHHSDSLIRPCIRLGVIPTGSTDTICYSVHGTDDIITACLHIVMGERISLDLGVIHKPDGEFLRYNMSILGYGFYGDLIKDSEAIRWMGPSRYDWLAVKKLLGRNVYSGQIEFVESTRVDCHPTDGSRCAKNCEVCLNESASQSTENWQTVSARCIAITSFMISCRCRKSPLGVAPSAHLADGNSDLVIINADTCTRFDFIRHLYRCARTDGFHQFDLPFVNVYRVSKFRFRPTKQPPQPLNSSLPWVTKRSTPAPPGDSAWNCDGELIDVPGIDFRIQRKAIQMFASGIDL